MRNKILTDLPIIKVLHSFEELKAQYNESVEIAKKFYVNHIPILKRTPENTLTIEERMTILLYKNNSDIVQSLTNYQTVIDSSLDTEYSPVYSIDLPTIDFITAFYIPEHVEWIELIDYIGYYTPVIDRWSRTFTHQDLNDLLEESRSIPKPRDFSIFEEETYYAQESEIIIDGIKYIRVIPVQPFLPIGKCNCSDLRIVTGEKCNIYIEMAITKNGFNKLSSIVLWSDKLKILRCYNKMLHSVI